MAAAASPWRRRVRRTSHATSGGDVRGLKQGRRPPPWLHSQVNGRRMSTRGEVPPRRAREQRSATRGVSLSTGSTVASLGQGARAAWLLVAVARTGLVHHWNGAQSRAQLLDLRVWGSRRQQMGRWHRLGPRGCARSAHDGRARSDRAPERATVSGSRSRSPRGTERLADRPAVPRQGTSAAPH